MSFDLTMFASAAAEGETKGKSHQISRPVSQDYDPTKIQKLVDATLKTYPELVANLDSVKKQGRRVDGTPIMLAAFAAGNRNVAFYSAKPGKTTAAVEWTNLEPVRL